MAYDPLLSPSLSHPLGTTPLGQDALCYLLKGIWSSVEAGLVATLTALSLLSLVGLLSLYKFPDWLLEVFVSFPRFSFLVFLALVLTLNPPLIGLIIGFFSSMAFSRSLVTKVKELRSSSFCLASKALGASDRWLFLKHCLPHMKSLLVRYSAISFAIAIYAEAGMAMLGLEDPSVPSVGRLFSLVESTPGAILTPAGQAQALASVFTTVILASLALSSMRYSKQ